MYHIFAVLHYKIKSYVCIFLSLCSTSDCLTILCSSNGLITRSSFLLQLISHRYLYISEILLYIKDHEVCCQVTSIPPFLHDDLAVLVWYSQGVASFQDCPGTRSDCPHANYHRFRLLSACVYKVHIIC